MNENAKVSYQKRAMRARKPGDLKQGSKTSLKSECTFKFIFHYYSKNAYHF